MRLPGLMCCGSATQALSSASLLGIVSEASVERVAMWVRSGPITPWAGVPRIWWQEAHAVERKAFLPAFLAGVTGGAAGPDISASHGRYTPGGPAENFIDMLQGWPLVNSAPLPSNPHCSDPERV